MRRWTEDDLKAVLAKHALSPAYEAQMRQHHGKCDEELGVGHPCTCPPGWPRRAAKPSKYRNVRVEVNGIQFDSKAEAAYYHELTLRQAAGEIGPIEVHPKWPLIVNGITVGHYEADFQYFDKRLNQGRVDDVKGAATLPLATWKQKHFKAQYGITVQEIRRGRGAGR